MILTALKELAEREGLVANPHFEEKAVSHTIVLDGEGKCLGISPTSEPAGGARKRPGNIS
jgi:hypothetical protein